MSDFTEQEFIEKYDEIKRIETAFLSPEQIPTAYILGGQPGAGKTGIQTEIISQNSKWIRLSSWLTSSMQTVTVNTIRILIEYKLNTVIPLLSILSHL